MNVLLVRKATNFELHGERIRALVAAGKLQPQELAELAGAHKEHYSCLDRLRKAFEQFGVRVTEVTRSSKWPTNERFDAVFTVGGDGTLLGAGHRIVDHTPVIGVRSSKASVGHLCVAGPEAGEAFVQKWLGGGVIFKDLARLSARLQYVQALKTTPDELIACGHLVYRSIPVLNDFLFCNSNPAATTRYFVALGERREMQKSSGVWVATAAGSSAAIAAAGGVRVPIESDRFQYCVREPYQSWIGAESREDYELVGGFFNPRETRLRLVCMSDEVVLSFDGQHGAVPMSFGDVVDFEEGPLLRVAVGMHGT